MQKSKALDWTELGAGSVPCQECRMLLGALRDAGHTLTTHEDQTGSGRLQITPKVHPALEKALIRHKEHLVATTIMISVPQILRVERGRLFDGTWQWESVAERETSYAKAPAAWDVLLRQVGSWSDGTTAYRAIWLSAGQIRRSANFPPWRRQGGSGERKA